MKTFIFLVLAAVLLVQFTDALPRPKPHLRIRREAIRQPRSTFFEESDDMSEHDKIMLFGVSELLELGNATVQKHKKFFNNVIKAAEQSSLNLNKELGEMRDFVKEVDQLENEEGERLFEKVFDLFTKASEIKDKYDLDEVKNPTDEQKVIARLFDENGYLILQLDFLGRIGTMREHFTRRFQTYVDGLSTVQKRKQRKFVNWFNKFKSEKDFEKNMEIMFEFFDLLED